MDLDGQQWIDGKWRLGEGVEWESKNPFTGEVLWRGRFASTQQAEEAVSNARTAFDSWSQSPLDDRIKIVQRFAEFLKQNHETFASLITSENGKPLWEARTEVNACVGKVQNSLDALMQRRWTTTEGSGNQISVIRYRPIGVMAVLGPFNLPAHLPGAHMVPALLAGNTIVFKPSEQTPAVGEFLARAWEAAGLPNGVVNMVHGQAETASAIAFSDATDGVLFTGSHRVGKILHEKLAGKVDKMLALELGGNNALVVDAMSNIDAAVHEIVLSSYITAGQRCTCARRLICTEDANAQAILDRLKQVVPNIRFGDPMSQPDVLIGSLISAQAGEHVLQGQQRWIDQGADVHHTMQPMKNHPSVLSPGLLEVANARARDEEIFGPMLLVEQAKDLDDAIAKANQTRYGLSAGLLSDDLDAFRHFVQRIRGGIVNWNRQTTGASGKLPFGGIGLSGNHRPSGFFAADYCSFPVASLETHQLTLPDKLHPGLDQLFGGE